MVAIDALHPDALINYTQVVRGMQERDGGERGREGGREERREKEREKGREILKQFLLVQEM